MHLPSLQRCVFTFAVGWERCHSQSIKALNVILCTKDLIKVQSENPDDDTCRTFVLNGEDHTLGNALRYMIMKNPDVQFCGYSIPHPSENKINVRIQTNGVPAIDVLKKGFTDLSVMCQHILKTFEKSVEDHRETSLSSRDVEMSSD